MTISEIKQVKAQASWEIKRILIDFCEMTGCNVTDISITLEENEIDNSIIINDVEITVEII